MKSRWSRVELALATDEDKHTLAHRAFDYTKLSAINMCPTWGILRYSHHKVMEGGGRSMALEAGTAMHECFAVVRLLQLGLVQGLQDHMHYHGKRLFGEARWDAIMAGANPADVSITLRNCALETLATTGYVDDPWDKRRTYINLETSLMYYTQRWDAARYPVWVRDVLDPTADVGVEIPFAVKVQPYGFEEVYAGHGSVAEREYELPPFVYTGRIDGLHHVRPGDNALLIQENKTASRLDAAWRMSFAMSHQVTGYTVAASLFTGEHVERGIVIGLSIPLPKTAHDGLVLEAVTRPNFMKERWFSWLEYTITIHDTYRDDVINAPRHTHSCNRYFRPCSMIPFCASDADEQKWMLEQMGTEEWSPLHDKTGD